MTSRSADLFREAEKYLAGGVSRNTLLRNPQPYYVSHGRGCRVVDVEGVERVDFANNMASLIHGHAYPAIVEAVTAQVQRGTAFTMATEIEIEFARHLCGRSPSFDKLRFVNSGTEAVMTALKASRAFTGRPKIAKVEGTYHGGYDYAEVSQSPAPDKWGRAERPESVALAAGTPAGVLQDVVILPFNDPAKAVEVLDHYRGQIACVLLDPMPHRAGLVAAEESFVSALREWTEKDGALLLFDEVITFRTEHGGMQARYGVRPDLTAMGKIIGGGFPVGALAGREDVMGVFAPRSGPRLPHSGTFSANPITMTAGLAAMSAYDEAAVARLNGLGDRVRSGLSEAIQATGAQASVTGTGSMFRLHMKAKPPSDYRAAFPSPEESTALSKLVNDVADAGFLLIYSGAGCLSTAMTEAEIDGLVEAVTSLLRKSERRS